MCVAEINILSLSIPVDCSINSENLFTKSADILHKGRLINAIFLSSLERTRVIISKSSKNPFAYLGT